VGDTEGSPARTGLTFGGTTIAHPTLSTESREFMFALVALLLLVLSPLLIPLMAGVVHAVRRQH
jgi:hypothetical protein